MDETRVLDAGYAEIQDDRPKNWFWDYQEVFFSDLSANAKIVRLCLAMHADHKNRSAFPSLNTMAKECNLSKHSIIKAIKELEDRAWIMRQQRKLPSSNFASTIYVLLSPPVVLAENNSPETQKGGSAPDALPPQTGGGWCTTETTPPETPSIDKRVVPQMHHPLKLEHSCNPVR